MALHTETQIYRTTLELAKLATQLVARMPRSYKPSFGLDFQRQCLGLVMRVYQANTSNDRGPILRLMREEIEKVNLAARLAVDLQLISKGQHARLMELVISAGKQTTGWLKHSEERLSSDGQGRRANAHR